MYGPNYIYDTKVRYAQQLFTKVREKRYPSFFDSPDIRGEALEDNISEKGISPELLALWDDVQKEKDDQSQKSQIKRDTQKAARRTEFNDNLWGKQWYMVSTCCPLDGFLLVIYWGR